MDAHRNLGGLRLFCEKRGGWGFGVAGRFWGAGVGGGGLAQKEKSPDFRCPEVGISAYRTKWITSTETIMQPSVECCI